MMRIKIGDIVMLNSPNIRKLIVDRRDEIVPANSNWRDTNHLKLRTVYRLAGDEYSDQWITDREIVSVVSSSR